MLEDYDGEATIAEGRSGVRVRCSFTVTRSPDGPPGWEGSLVSFQILRLGRTTLRLPDGRRGTILIGAVHDVSPFRASFRGIGDPPK